VLLDDFRNLVGSWRSSGFDAYLESASKLSGTGTSLVG